MHIQSKENKCHSLTKFELVSYINYALDKKILNGMHELVAWCVHYTGHRLLCALYQPYCGYNRAAGLYNTTYRSLPNSIFLSVKSFCQYIYVAVILMHHNIKFLKSLKLCKVVLVLDSDGGMSWYARCCAHAQCAHIPTLP